MTHRISLYSLAMGVPETLTGGRSYDQTFVVLSFCLQGCIILSLIGAMSWQAKRMGAIGSPTFVVARWMLGAIGVCQWQGASTAHPLLVSCMGMIVAIEATLNHPGAGINPNKTAQDRFIHPIIGVMFCVSSEAPRLVVGFFAVNQLASAILLGVQPVHRILDQKYDLALAGIALSIVALNLVGLGVICITEFFIVRHGGFWVEAWVRLTLLLIGIQARDLGFQAVPLAKQALTQLVKEIVGTMGLAKKRSRHVD
jgi:hypothetical protein